MNLFGMFTSAFMGSTTPYRCNSSSNTYATDRAKMRVQKIRKTRKHKRQLAKKAK